ncbi:hypothetical protein BC777_2582 [Yoonia maricola]|uniref:Tetratricopeptide repeat protein n=1 Tax=Yoonia maricola TaxID=420999 RepID=A0A2M8W5K8_9RHOB|nr:hypothetical protein [Yoonia maricola]PJI86215.1 hypothetical protein BC777_2582 [Yoonia maricola]
MKYIDKLSYVQIRRGFTWRDKTDTSQKQFTHAELREILRPEIDIAESSYSKILRGVSVTGNAKNLLNNKLESCSRDILTEIERRLELPGLFDCQNRAALDELLDVGELAAIIDVYDTKGDPKTKRLKRQAHQSEAALLKELAERLVYSKDNLLHVPAELLSGSSYFAHLLLKQPEIQRAYSKVVFIRPDTIDNAFDEQILALSDHLGVLEEGVPGLLRKIKEDKLLVVFLDAHFLDLTEMPGMKPMLKLLLNESVRTRMPNKGTTSILLIGESMYLDLRREPSMTGGKGTWYSQVKIEDESRFEFFNTQWKGLSKLRKNTPIEDGGARVKPAQAYYKIGNDQPAWPNDIAHRALFATNIENHAFFDPTIGYSKLLGDMTIEPPFVTMHYDDMRNFMLWVDAPKSETKHPHQAAKKPASGKGFLSKSDMIRYLSTTKYWMMSDSLLPNSSGRKRPGLLCKHEGVRTRDVSPKAFEKAVGLLSPPLKRHNPIDARITEHRYSLPFSLKAFVQDEWQTNGTPQQKFMRSVAHHQIAERLYWSKDDVGLLKSEYPYEPHRGETKLYFVADTICHLMRSLQGHTFELEAYEKKAFVRDNYFPKTPEIDGTDPNTLALNASEILGFCFEQLYIVELNKKSRALSKKHGAYNLALELLQHMGHNQTVGVPHPAMSPHLWHAYVKECGHALIDVGDLEAALRCFESLREMPQPNDEVFRDLDDDLSIALVQTLLGKTEEAHKSLERCAAFFPDDDDLVRRKNDKKLHIFNCKPDKQELALALYKRYQARQANLMYIAKEFPNSLKRVEMIEKAYGQGRKLYAPVRFLGVDLDTLFMSATYHTGSPEAEAQAMSYALEAILRADANGDHHDAMKYKILLGRFYRRKGDLINAQVCLSQVQKDLRTYGCSERVFFAAYSESGKILDCNHDYVRAYASFHRPFLMRAAFRKFSGASQQAHAHCVNALALIETEHLASTSEEWGDVIKKAQTDHATEMKNYQRQLVQDGRVRDPMYGYSLSKTREVIDSLKDADGIKQQIKKIEELREIAGIG